VRLTICQHNYKAFDFDCPVQRSLNTYANYWYNIKGIKKTDNFEYIGLFSIQLHHNIPEILHGTSHFIGDLYHHAALQVKAD